MNMCVHIGLLMPHYASGQGCSILGDASLLGTQKTQRQGTVLGYLTSRQQSRSHPHPWPYTVREDKKLQNLNHALIVQKHSDADPSFPDCNGTWWSELTLLFLEWWQQLVPTTAAHGTSSSHSMGKHLPDGIRGSWNRAENSSVCFSWKINRVALLLRNVSGKTVALFNTISSSLTDWKIVKAAI